jgi:large subunit ribosomal protein L18
MAYGESRAKRHRRVRAKVSGTPERPRLAVYRSNSGIYGQLIDDVNHKTLLSVSPIELKGKKVSKVEQSQLLGKALSTKALEKKINTIVFDRGGYRYHGRIKAFADAAREGGLQF